MKIISLIVFFLCCFRVNGQPVNVDDPTSQASTTFFNTVDGVPVMNPKYARIVEGSMYEPVNFTKALVFVRNNKRPFRVEARINILEERLHYLDEKKQEKYSVSPIEEVQFFEAEKKIGVYALGLPGCLGSPNGWYEVLEKGKISLYRKVNKNVSEVKQYGSATADQKLITTYSYWINNKNNCQQFNKISQLQIELIQLNPAMKEHLPKRKLSDKKLEDWTELVRIYNAL